MYEASVSRKMDATGHTLDEIIEKRLNAEQLKQFRRIYYGRDDHAKVPVSNNVAARCKKEDIDIAAYSFMATEEQIRRPRIVKIGLIQHSIVLHTDRPPKEQREAVFRKVSNLIHLAKEECVQIVCLQETWSMPFFLCTGEKEKWSEFAESAENGPSTTFLKKLAKKLEIVIISPILEDDDGVWWNTAVVIDENGNFMGKHRKNHLPSRGSFSETACYAPGDMGHAVFNTKFAKIAVNICYGRHHALNWLMFGLNGAEIVFNPAATISEFGESFWSIEARNAAVANGYFTCSINRVGTEIFNIEKDEKKIITRSYYGSSYVTAPNGCRSPTLSRVKDGLLIAEFDLNLCRQVKDQWGFNMTSRLELYAETLSKLNH